MSRTVMPYTINGLVQINGRMFWRIDDLSANLTAVQFINSPAALVRAYSEDPLGSAERARAVCEAMNSHHAQALMNLAMVEGGR